MSSSALPQPRPNQQPPVTPGPQVVPPPTPSEPQRGGSGWLWGILALAGLAAAGYYLWPQTGGPQGPTLTVTRTAVAKQDRVVKTIRLTGTTAAGRYVSLIAPSLRGGRGGGAGGGGGTGGGGGGTGGGGGNALASSSSRTGSATSTTATVSSSSNSSQGAGGSAFSGGGDTIASSVGSASSGMRSARSASGAASRTPTRAASSGSRTSSSSARGSDNIGSTSGMLQGGGGGGGGTGGGGGGGNTGGGGGGGGGGTRGGGGGDFSLQIQELIKSGMMVKPGDKLAEFDRQYMLTRLDDYKSTVIQSEASYKKQLADLEVTRKSYDQQVLAVKNQMQKAELDMRTIPVRSAIESERLRLALEEAKANLKQLEAARRYLDIGEQSQVKISNLNLQQTKLELKRAEANADRMVVRAPIAGMAVMQNTFRGSEFGPIQQGDQVFPGQLFMQVVDPSSMVVTAAVNQTDVQSLRIGQKASVRFDAFPGLVLPGRIVMIGAITKAGGVRGAFKKDVPVRLKLEQMDPRVIPDLSVSADVEIDEESNAITLPREALLRDGTSTYVMVRTTAGKWERRSVEVGLVTNTDVAIRTGIKPGETIALDATEVMPGDAVEKASGPKPNES